MRAIRRLIVLAVVVSLFAGCMGDKTNPDPCEGVDCSGHGQCQVTAGVACCECDPGYRPQGLTCVPEVVDPCQGVDCSSHGTCREVDGNASCDCDPGYRPVGLECVQESDPCAGVTCSSHGTCKLDAQGDPFCECDPDYHPDGLDCLPDADRCQGVTCSNHGTCVIDAQGNPVCECDPGYHAEGLNCITDGGSCDPALLRAEALSSGNVILGGVTLGSSTPIPEVNADINGFEGQHIQVEGLVTYVCSGSGNRMTLQDSAGNTLTVAGNHNFYLPNAVEIGQYAVVEGIFYLYVCRRPPHVNHGQHGIVLSDTICPID